MATAKAVYERFLLTPLKLKPRPQEDAADAEAAVSAVALDFATGTDEDEDGDHARQSRGPPGFASPEVERLRGRIESADLSNPERPSEAAKAAPPTGFGAADALPSDRRRCGQKKKRASRAAPTPSRADRPAKRSRASAETDKENRDEALAPVRRRNSDSFAGAETDDRTGRDAAPDAAAASTSGSTLVDPVQGSLDASSAACRRAPSRSLGRSRRLARPSSDQDAPPAPADVVTPLCDALIATDTISGLLFALSLNALRSVEPSPSCPCLDAATAASALQDVYGICRAIAQCEQLARQQAKRPTVQLPPTRRHSTSARALEQVLAANPSVGDSSASTPRAEAKKAVKTKKKKKKKKKKKSVRFRSFDLSCLNLQYVENERVARMVDRMIAAYGSLMDVVASTLGRDETQAATLHMLREFAGAMESEAWLLRGPGDDTALGPDALHAARVVDAAFSSQDSATQHEIRLAAAYFAQQLARLEAPSSFPPAFLQEPFSVLISSAVRFKLRLLFLHATNKEEEEEEAGATPEALIAATYAHQDVGAAIHRALQESLLYLPLAAPMLALLGDQQTREGEGGDRVDAVTKQLRQCSLDEVERVDQFILARRFLRFHVARALDPQSPSAEFTAGLWTEIERACSIAQRFHFEDEAHLFPLASVAALSDALTSEAAPLSRLDHAVQAFWDAQHGHEASRANGLHECGECRSVIARAEAAASIVCSLCTSRFHLACLHLPASFAQFAAHYTCPACFLGRRRVAY